MTAADSTPGEVWIGVRDVCGLPRMPGSPVGVRQLAAREGWRTRQVQGRGPTGTNTQFHRDDAMRSSMARLNPKRGTDARAGKADAEFKALFLKWREASTPSQRVAAFSALYEFAMS